MWRVVEGGAASPQPALAVEAAADPATAVGEPASLVEATADAHDDAEVLASLPSLDDWQLVDADAFPAAAPAAARETSNAVPELPDSLAGLELVPMEAIAAVQIHTDPIERWLHESEPRKSGASAGGAVKTGSGGKA